jgi:hypothetical protein
MYKESASEIQLCLNVKRYLFIHWLQMMEVNGNYSTWLVILPQIGLLILPQIGLV